LNSCIVTKPAEEPEEEISAQLPGHRPGTTTGSPASPVRPSGGRGGEVRATSIELPNRDALPAVIAAVPTRGPQRQRHDVAHQEDEFEAALARIAEFAAGGVPSARTDGGQNIAEVGT
jgi:hypothetical protein